jgi:transcriptional regulator with XRE-family HTH domain
MTVKFNVGSKIKQLRESKQLSIEDVAHGSHMSVDQLTQIEENKIAPGIGMMIRLARTMNVRLGTFLDDQSSLGPTLVRANEHHDSMKIVDPGKKNANLNFFSLAPDKNDRSMEPFIVTIDPLDPSNKNFSSHEGEEFLYVLEGELEIVYGKETYRLSPGDSIYIDSIVDHQIKTANDKQAKVLVVIYVPI